MTRMLVLWLLLAMSNLVKAAGPLAPDDDSKGVEFSLRLARAKTPLDYGNRNYDTTSRWLGVSLREKVSDRITLGMYGGHAGVTQTNNPVTAGIELDGYHAGFSFHGIILTGQRASLFYTLDYFYQKVDHKSDTQAVVIEWFEPRAQIGALLTLSPHLRLYGGGSYGYIDGEERVSGGVNSTTNFRRDARTGGFIGLDLNTDPDGYVGIEARSGLTRSMEIYFKRRY